MALNKVGSLSPVLFCIYIDGLLTTLSESGFGCYMGDNFLGALGYADDIVLIAPSPSAIIIVYYAIRQPNKTQNMHKLVLKNTDKKEKKHTLNHMR